MNTTKTVHLARIDDQKSYVTILEYDPAAYRAREIEMIEANELADPTPVILGIETGEEWDAKQISVAELEPIARHAIGEFEHARASQIMFALQNAMTEPRQLDAVKMAQLFIIVRD